VGEGNPRECQHKAQGGVVWRVGFRSRFWEPVVEWGVKSPGSVEVWPNREDGSHRASVANSGTPTPRAPRTERADDEAGMDSAAGAGRLAVSGKRPGELRFGDLG
jgi:hypothetical protein